MAVYPGVYTGVHGICTVGGSEEEVVEVDIAVTRGAVAIPRAGKYSDKKVPGKIDVKISVKKTLSDGAFFGRIINGTPVTGAAETLKTGVALDADGYTAMTDTVIASASRVRATCASSAITTAGTLTFIGEDANGNYQEETVDVTTLGVGEYVTSTKLFKEVYGVVVLAIRSSGAGTFTIASITGASSYTVGDPSIFNFVGKWDKGTPGIVFTCNNCFLTSAKSGFGDVSKASQGDYEIVMQDVDEDFDMSYVAES